ncbi:MAG: DinB family protein [Planctomycetota bacterium]|nr:MAG: DinB family protein [Planctomycetota bacterium]
MADVVTGFLLHALTQQRAYAERLVADLSDADMVAQPVPGVVMNHPAWVLGHLSAYPPTLAAMLRGEPPADPKDHPFGRDSTPSADLALYGSKADALGAFNRVHDDLARALEQTAGARFGDPNPLPRWRERFPTIADACFYLTTVHLATHLGQLSAWRRAGGRPPV